MPRLLRALTISACLGLGCATTGDEGGAGTAATGGTGGAPLKGSGGAGAPPSAGSGGSAGGAGGTATASGGSGPGTGGAAVAVDAPPATDSSAAPTDGAASSLPGGEGLVRIFDGTSFDSWVYNPAAWTLKDGAMVGKTASGQSQAFTKMDYSNFRLIVSSRMVNGNDHLGICLWGGRPAAGSYGFARCLLVIPPNAAIWDYLTNTDNPKPGYQVGMKEFHRTEILANRTTGKVLVAVNGKLLHEYQDPPGKLTQRKHGPVGMQIHKAGTESEYKDIWIEVDPKSDKLITLLP